MRVPEEHLDLLRKLLTKEESETIIPLFLKNYDKKFASQSKKKVGDGTEVLNTAFNWEISLEGDDYWRTIYKKIHDRLHLKQQN